MLEEILSRTNMIAAYERVVSNKGAAGVDKMSVEALLGHMQCHWAAIKQELVAGAYIPQAVRKVEIPKPSGGKRMLGIPTVTDRLIQQAIAQQLTVLYDSGFSESSYGFRPGRSAHQALRAALRCPSDRADRLVREAHRAGRRDPRRRPDGRPARPRGRREALSSRSVAISRPQSSRLMP